MQPAQPGPGAPRSGLCQAAGDSKGRSHPAPFLKHHPPMPATLSLSGALGHAHADKRIDILRHIGVCGSISQAARAVGVSYKAGWRGWRCAPACATSCRAPLGRWRCRGRSCVCLCDWRARMARVVRMVRSNWPRASRARVRSFWGCSRGWRCRGCARPRRCGWNALVQCWRHSPASCGCRPRPCAWCAAARATRCRPNWLRACSWWALRCRAVACGRVTAWCWCWRKTPWCWHWRTAEALAPGPVCGGPLWAVGGDGDGDGHGAKPQVSGSDFQIVREREGAAQTVRMCGKRRRQSARMVQEWSGSRMMRRVRCKKFHLENIRRRPGNHRVTPRDWNMGRAEDTFNPNPATPSAGDSQMQVQFTVNGRAASVDVPPETLLVHALREQLGLTGTHVGCDTSQCGACTVLLDGRAVKSCAMLAVQAQGAEVTTIEGLAAADGTLHPMQAAFKECHGLQCGFCTPGMVLSAVDLCRSHPDADAGQIRELLEGNICRCTGYQNIVRAVQAGQKAMASSA